MTLNALLRRCKMSDPMNSIAGAAATATTAASAATGVTAVATTTGGRYKNPHTHISMIHPYGKFNIAEPSIESFWEYYGNSYMHEILGIAERTGHLMPVLVDVDIKYEITDDPEWRREASSFVDRFSNSTEGVVRLEELGSWSRTELYDMDFADHLTEIYQKVLGDVLQDLYDDDDLACFLMTKPAYITLKGSRAFLKHGFHLHFPAIFVGRQILECEVHERVRLEMKRLNHGLHVPGATKVEDMVDKSTYRGESSSWLLYGSRKSEGMDSYTIHSVHTPARRRVLDWRSFLIKDMKLHNNMNRRSDEDDPDEEENDEDHEEAFQQHRGYCLFREVSPMGEETLDITEETLDVLLPRIFSTRVGGRSASYVRTIREDLIPIREILRKNVPKTFGMPSSSTLPPYSSDRDRMGDKEKNNDNDDVLDCMTSHEIPDEERVLELMTLLSNKRSVDRNDWIHVGWTLYNIFDGSMRGKEIWIEFSRRAGDYFDADSCQYEWGKMKKQGLTLGTLKFMAKNDSPNEYSILMSKYTKAYMDKSTKLGGSHHDLALALFQKYDNEFICASSADKLWYRFMSPTWVKDEEGISLRRLITSELVPDYERIGKDIFTKQVNADAEESKMYAKKVDVIMRQIGKLKSSPFKSNVMKECAEVFYDGSFYRQLDQNAFLIAFENGVYDFHHHVFREGRPNDRLSLKMPIQFRQDLTHDHHDVRLVHDFFVKIFPDASVREYFFNVTCDIFIGGNIQKIVQVWSGGGNNGKSVTQRLFEKMLGPYSIKLPTSLLVGKRTQSSSACPELARAGHGVRLAMLQEPDGNDVINVGILKELSGNDTFFARGLYKEGGEITPMFKLVLVCNDPPRVPNNDKAAWNRIRVIPFESTFSDKAPETFEEQLLHKHFPMDRYFENTTLPFMVEPFAWLLIEHLKKRPKMYPEPPKVMLATTTYKRQNDIYGQFVEENIEEGAEESMLRLTDIYNHFKEWYRDSNPQGSLPSKADVKEYLQKAWGQGITGNGAVRWKGYRMRSVVNEGVLGKGEEEEGGEAIFEE